MNQHKYLLSKAWGYGFFSDVMVALGHLLIAELTARTPVVYWGDNSLFKSDELGNAFTSFFQPINDVSLQDLEVPELSFFPGKWNYQNLRREDYQKWEGADARIHGYQYLARNEDVVVCDFYTAFPELESHISPHSRWAQMKTCEVYRHLIGKYLKPVPAIVSEVEETRQALIGDRTALAVHFRGTDIAKEIINYDLNLILSIYYNAIEALLRSRPCDCIFLMSDDSSVVDYFKEKFGSLVVCTDSARTSGTDGLHHLNPCMEAGREVLIDALLALSCDYFLGNGLSNPSCFIYSARDWRGNAVLLGGNKLAEKNEFIYQRVGQPTL